MAGIGKLFGGLGKTVGKVAVGSTITEGVGLLTGAKALGSGVSGLLKAFDSHVGEMGFDVGDDTVTDRNQKILEEKDTPKRTQSESAIPLKSPRIQRGGFKPVDLKLARDASRLSASDVIKAFEKLNTTVTRNLNTINANMIDGLDFIFKTVHAQDQRLRKAIDTVDNLNAKVTKLSRRQNKMEYQLKEAGILDSRRGGGKKNLGAGFGPGALSDSQSAQQEIDQRRQQRDEEANQAGSFGNLLTDFAVGSAATGVAKGAGRVGKGAWNVGKRALGYGGAAAGAATVGETAAHVAPSALAKGGAKTAAKIGGRAALTGARAIPGLGTALGLGMAGYHAMQGDWTGAGLAAGSAIPGPIGWGFLGAEVSRDLGVWGGGGGGDDEGDAKKLTPESQKQGETASHPINISSEKDINIISKADIAIRTTQDVAIKGRKITLTGEQIIFESKDIQGLTGQGGGAGVDARDGEGEGDETGSQQQQKPGFFRGLAEQLGIVSKTGPDGQRIPTDFEQRQRGRTGDGGGDAHRHGDGKGEGGTVYKPGETPEDVPGTPFGRGEGFKPTEGVEPSPITGKLGQGLGAARPGHLHAGRDISAEHGSPIYARGEGTIIKYQVNRDKYGYGGTQGGQITVRYKDGKEIVYLHTSSHAEYGGEAKYKVGDKVKAGDVIGLSGTAANHPHLHYEVYEYDFKTGRRGRNITDQFHTGPAGQWTQGGRVFAGTGYGEKVPPPGPPPAAGSKQTAKVQPPEAAPGKPPADQTPGAAVPDQQPPQGPAAAPSTPPGGLTPSQQFLQSKTPEEANAAIARSKTDWTKDGTPQIAQPGQQAAPQATPTPQPAQPGPQATPAPQASAAPPTGGVRPTPASMPASGGLSADKRGNVDANEIYRAAVARFQNSPLNGFVPKDGEKWGIKTGSPQEWARLMVALARQESSLNAHASNGGLYQFNPADLKRYGVDPRKVHDPNASMEAAIRQFERFIPKSGVIAGRDANGKWLGGSAYFEPLRKPWQLMPHMPWATGIAAKNSDAVAAITGGGTNQPTPLEQALPFDMGPMKVPMPFDAEGPGRVQLTPGEKATLEQMPGTMHGFEPPAEPTPTPQPDATPTPPSPEQMPGTMHGFEPPAEPTPEPPKPDATPTPETSKPGAWAKLEPTPEQKAETDKVWGDVDKQRKPDGSFDVVGKPVTAPVPFTGRGENPAARVLGDPHGGNFEGKGPSGGDNGYGDGNNDVDGLGICSA